MLKTKIMTTKRIICLLISVLFFVGGIENVHAQQAPKKTKATKTTPKKTTKPAVVKKKAVAKKAGEVFIWDGGYFYHSRATCEVLTKPKRRIISVPVQQAKDQFSCKKCKKCF